VTLNQRKTRKIQKKTVIKEELVSSEIFFETIETLSK